MKLPWKNIEESSRESAKKISELSEKVDRVLDHISKIESRRDSDIEEIRSRLGKIETSVAVIYESGSQKELDLLASNRTIMSSINRIQERVVEMDYLAIPEASRGPNVLAVTKDRVVNFFKCTKNFLARNHLLISSLLFMAAAAMGVVYLVTYLL